MADRDGDSQMHSSPSSSASDSEMFPEPAAADPSTPRARALHGADMSPPASQRRGAGDDGDRMDTRGTDGAGDNEDEDEDEEDDDAADQHSELGDAAPSGGGGGGGGRSHDGERDEERRRAETEPGWAWKNPKAREEADRSAEAVLDAGFSMRPFGELFDEAAVPRPLGAAL